MFVGFGVCFFFLIPKKKQTVCIPTLSGAPGRNIRPELEIIFLCCSDITGLRAFISGCWLVGISCCSTKRMKHACAAVLLCLLYYFTRLFASS